jgi:hypothetical protein
LKISLVPEDVKERFVAIETRNLRGKEEWRVKFYMIVFLS